MKTHSYNSLKLLCRTIPFYRFFKKAESWSRDQLETFQLKKLQEITDYAYQHVPYYRESYKKSGFLPGDIKTFDDFKKLPCLTKEILRNNPSEYFYSDENKFLNISYVRTSGSTGIPLAFACDIDSVAAKYAITYRALFAAGYKLGDIQLIIKNFPNLKTACSYDRILRQLYVHAYRLNKKGIEELIPLISKHPPKHILAHPSVLLELGLYLEKNKSINLRPIGISSFAEVLYPILRKRLEETFLCHVFDFYSNQESSLVAYEIENHEFLFGEQFSFPEIVDYQNNVLSGELITTAFFSKAMPLIRYMNKDIVSLRKAKKDELSCFLHLNHVDGRITERITLPSGISIGLFSLMKADLRNVGAYQFVQTSPNSICINYIPINESACVNEDSMRNEMLLYVGSDVQVSVKAVNSLYKNSAGKVPRTITYKE